MRAEQRRHGARGGAPGGRSTSAAQPPDRQSERQRAPASPGSQLLPRRATRRRALCRAGLVLAHGPGEGKLRRPLDKRRGASGFAAAPRRHRHVPRQARSMGARLHRDRVGDPHKGVGALLDEAADRWRPDRRHARGARRGRAVSVPSRDAARRARRGARASRRRHAYQRPAQHAAEAIRQHTPVEPWLGGHCSVGVGRAVAAQPDGEPTSAPGAALQLRRRELLEAARATVRRRAAAAGHGAGTRGARGR